MSRRLDRGRASSTAIFCWCIGGVAALLMTMSIDMGNPIAHVPEPGTDESWLFESTCGVCWVRLIGWLCFLRAWWIRKHGLWVEDTAHDRQPATNLPVIHQPQEPRYDGGYQQLPPGEEQYLVFEGKVRTNNPNIDLQRVMKGRFRDE